MNRLHAVSLLLGGVVLSCGAAAVAPMATSWAQPASGKWQCFVVDRLPDIDEARSWEGASNITDGLNRIALHVPSGTVLSVTPQSSHYGSYASVACIKYP
jgi:hypothetical protein